MNNAPANSPALEIGGPEPGEGWTRTRWLTLVALIFAAHVAFIFAFGEKKEIVPRAVTNAPSLKLANDADELLALNDPTLFALPHERDFASAVWLKMPDVKQPSFRWTEPPRWLPLAAENLGATFQQFMRTNHFTGHPLDFKPPPKLSESVLPIETAFAETSTLQFAGALAQRLLPGEINLPSLPYNDVIAPSVVQVLVDPAGDVVSAVLLPTEDTSEAASRADIGDTNALQIARALRFAPAKNLAVGQVIFNWRTIPMATTNDNSNAH